MNTTPDDLEGRLQRSLDVGAPDLDRDIVTGAPGRKAPRMVNRGRVAQIAAGSVTAVAAASVGALVISGTFMPSQPPLFTAAAGGADSGRIAGAESAMSDDAMIMPWVQYEYLAGPGLSDELASGRVYELRRAGSPDDVLARVAALFGVTGEVESSEWSSDDFPSYVVGPEDGSAPAITTTWVGTGNWWYSNPLPYTENPPSPSQAPDEGAARSLAADLFADVGLDIDAADIEVYADEWQTTASGYLTVDGQRTALDWGVSWAATGEIQWASGHSIEVVDRGEFDTVSARASVERLADWRWSAAAGPDYWGDTGFMAADSASSSGVARSDESVVEPMPGMEPAPEPGAPGDPGAAPGDPGTGEPAPIEPVEPTKPAEPSDPAEPTEPTEPSEPVEPSEPTEPQPLPEPAPEPLPEPELVTVTLDSADRTLLTMWDANGNAWLVPGFVYEMPDGWYSGVVSLIEGVIELPEPIDYEIMPMDDGVGVIEPGVVDEGRVENR
ncbi:hypothetical protein EV141_0585 [Microcella putealis]|uniref:Uncharacterized protein n=1 Tax=Microcella putealis TaxID=337005 RepID=A0A4Q7LY61_9MICO|nr:hypothetical protein [Microcella putealis]RZS59362.1 hypothetical protein EV141_0585 [Microcella putealis]TQM19987.1 hypothetical protein BJ957_2122 [Microcella putealis]